VSCTLVLVDKTVPMGGWVDVYVQSEQRGEMTSVGTQSAAVPPSQNTHTHTHTHCRAVRAAAAAAVAAQGGSLPHADAAGSANGPGGGLFPSQAELFWLQSLRCTKRDRIISAVRGVK
jgi:hypothetical protein